MFIKQTKNPPIDISIISETKLSLKTNLFKKKKKNYLSFPKNNDFFLIATKLETKVLKIHVISYSSANTAHSKMDSSKKKKLIYKIILNEFR